MLHSALTAGTVNQDNRNMSSQSRVVDLHGLLWITTNLCRLCRQRKGAVERMSATSSRRHGQGFGEVVEVEFWLIRSCEHGPMQQLGLWNEHLGKMKLTYICLVCKLDRCEPKIHRWSVG